MMATSLTNRKAAPAYDDEHQAPSVRDVIHGMGVWSALRRPGLGEVSGLLPRRLGSVRLGVPRPWGRVSAPGRRGARCPASACEFRRYDVERQESTRTANEGRDNINRGLETA